MAVSSCKLLPSLLTSPKRTSHASFPGVPTHFWNRVWLGLNHMLLLEQWSWVNSTQKPWREKESYIEPAPQRKRATLLWAKQNKICPAHVPAIQEQWVAWFKIRSTVIGTKCFLLPFYSDFHLSLSIFFKNPLWDNLQAHVLLWKKYAYLLRKWCFKTLPYLKFAI